MACLLYAAVVVATVLVALTLVVPPGFHRASALEPAASYVAKKKVYVVCPNTQAAWSQYVRTISPDFGMSVGGLTDVGGDTVSMSYGVCSTLAGRPALTSLAYAGAIVVLTHESIHARGERDEGATECHAMHEAPGIAVRFFRVKPGKQLRALMAAAWAAHRASPPAYQSAC